MNNEIDLLDELDREERDERLAASGGGAGAALGVFLTLVIGCGLVFAAYKLGQRKNVDEPPVIAAADGPIKIAPENPGGSAIANTGNLANAMIDGSQPGAGEYALRDGLVVEADLPKRDIDPAAALEAREIRREIVDLNDLAMKSDINGAPELMPESAPDRSDEHLLAAGAEVTPNARDTAEVIAGIERPGAEAMAAAGAANGTEEPGNVNTSIAALPGSDPDTEIAGIPDMDGIVPLPMRKPALGPSTLRRPPAQLAEADTPALAPETRAPEQRVRQPQVEPAVASRLSPVSPPAPAARMIQPVPQVPASPGVQHVRIPPQPFGDAQVQLGAYPSAEEVRARWSQLRSANRDLLGPLGLQVLPVRTADGRQLFRMRVGPLRDGQMASRLCQALRGRGTDCFVPVR